MASNLPSSFSKPGAQPPPPAYSPPAQREQPRVQSDSSPLALYAAIIALLMGIVSLYGTFFMDKPLSPAQKEVLLGIAQDLRALQDREIQLSAPVTTTIELNRSYPIAELFPPQFQIPLRFNIPVDTQLVGVSTTGTPVTFRVQDNVSVSTTIPISSVEAFGDNTIRIQKTLPVEARFTSIVKVRTAYGTDLNKMIDKLESLAQGS